MAQLANGLDKFLGNIITNNDPSPEEFTKFWNQATFENMGKWGSAERVRDQMNWDPIDQAVGFSKTANVPLKQHTFIWGQQQPEWMDQLSTEEQLAEVEEWMELFAERYGEDIAMIDVVNEPLHAKPGYREALGGDNGLYGTGWDWVIWSFEKARTLFPEAELLLNDYGIINSRKGTDDYLVIIQLLQERKLIDGIGVQAHGLENTSLTLIKENLDKLAATDLPIYVSELDIDIADDDRQRDRFAELFPLLWEHPQVKGVTLWGYEEGEIWKPNAFLVRRDGSERPALTWLDTYIADQQVPDPEGGASIQLNILLEGMWDSDNGHMQSTLVQQQLLPLSQPFTQPPFNYNGTEQLAPYPPDIVDWVLIEVRDANDSSKVITSQAAVLDVNGVVRNVNLEDKVVFEELAEGTYYVAIFHKGHLGIMSSQPIHIRETDPILYDFSSSVNQAAGTLQLKEISGRFVMFSGDYDQNGIVNNLDVNLWSQHAAALNQYLDFDADGNGIVNNKDYNFWANNRSKIGVLIR